MVYYAILVDYYLPLNDDQGTSEFAVSFQCRRLSYGMKRFPAPLGLRVLRALYRYDEDKTGLHGENDSSQEGCLLIGVGLEVFLCTNVVSCVVVSLNIFALNSLLLRVSE